MLCAVVHKIVHEGTTEWSGMRLVQCMLCNTVGEAQRAKEKNTSRRDVMLFGCLVARGITNGRETENGLNLANLPLRQHPGVAAGARAEGVGRGRMLWIHTVGTV